MSDDTSYKQKAGAQAIVEEPGFNVYFSRFAFMFLIFTVICSGEIHEILSCQMRLFLKNSLYARHVLAILLIFVFIMMEGGWSFDYANDISQSNNWASGHVIHSFIMSTCIYGLFLISSKSKLIPNIVFYSLVLSLYFINTQRSYWLAREQISPETNTTVLFGETIIAIVAVGVLIYGFIDYTMYQMHSYGQNFDWQIFLFGTQECQSIVNLNQRRR